MARDTWKAAHEECTALVPGLSAEAVSVARYGILRTKEAEKPRRCSVCGGWTTRLVRIR